MPVFIAFCDKKQFHYLLNQVNVGDFEELFIASIRDDCIQDRLIGFSVHTISSMVKDGISDVSISVNFFENEMIISLLKSNEKSEVIFDKEKILSIFKM